MSRREVDVSVIIPTYNRTELLSETLESVVAQTVQPREIIVVDNGNARVARAIVARFGDSVKLIEQIPCGKQVARNTGIAAASSTWIAPLDDDDIYHPNFFEAALPAIDDDRVDLIGADHRRRYSDRFEEKTNFELAPAGYWDGVPRPAPGAHWSFVGQFPVDRLLTRIPFYPSMMLFRKSMALEIGGYDTGVRGIFGEDIDFLARALSVARTAIIWEPLVDYRVHESNDTKGKHRRTLGRWEIFEQLLTKRAALQPQFVEALERDLPQRRGRALDTAFILRRFEDMRAAARKIGPTEWTLKRRLKFLFAVLPHQFALSVLGPGQSQAGDD